MDREYIPNLEYWRADETKNYGWWKLISDPQIFMLSSMGSTDHLVAIGYDNRVIIELDVYLDAYTLLHKYSHHKRKTHESPAVWIPAPNVSHYPYEPTSVDLLNIHQLLIYYKLLKLINDKKI